MSFFALFILHICKLYCVKCIKSVNHDYVIAVELCEPACGGPATVGTSGAAGPSSVPPPLENNAHSPPYDLRRKSPPHFSQHGDLSTCNNIQCTSMNTASTCNPTYSTSTTISSTIVSPASLSTSTMLPSRKRSRRSCSACHDSEFFNLPFVGVIGNTGCKLFQIIFQVQITLAHHITCNTSFLMKYCSRYSNIY